MASTYTVSEQNQYKAKVRQLAFEPEMPFLPFEVGKRIKRIVLVLLGRKSKNFFLLTPPLGIMYLSSYIKSKRPDIEISLVDQKLLDVDEHKLAEIICEKKPDLVGMSVISPNSAHFRPAALALKKRMPNIPLVLGGAHASAEEEKVFKQGPTDFVVSGEGEDTLLQLIAALENGVANLGESLRDSFAFSEVAQDPMYASLEAISGLHFISAGSIIKKPFSAKIENLDDLPHPDWQGIDIEAYAHEFSMTPVGHRNYMAVFTSRGCPYRCNYCHSNFGKTFRSRSPENVVDELEILVNQYNVHNFEFIDDIFNFSKKRTIAICQEILRRNLKIEFSFPNGVRADLLDFEVIDHLHAAGCYFMSFAIETATPDLQKHIQKFMNLDKLKENVNYAASKGIFCNGFFMLGFVGETREQIERTIDFAVNLRIHTASFFIVTPYGGTTLYDNVDDEKRNLDFNDFDSIFGKVNLSALTDKELYGLQRLANRRFYLRPRRIFRILKDLPFKRNILTFIWIFIKRAFTRSGRPEEHAPAQASLSPAEVRS